MIIVIKVSFWRMKILNLVFLTISKIGGFLICLIRFLILKGKIVGIF